MEELLERLQKLYNECQDSPRTNYGYPGEHDYLEGKLTGLRLAIDLVKENLND